ncbi:MAG TPA: hypothetical protein VK978_02970 [Candidatus Saccharimonadales bacterium]|nr:hypothetical protein [Candidatus Saccharimonadales bacterium]
MGCREQDSNFNRTIFQDGQWWATWGLESTWEGPINEVKKRFPDFEEPTFEMDGLRFSAEQQGEGQAFVKFLGHTAAETL